MSIARSAASWATSSHGLLQFRRQDLADPADAGLAAGRTDPPLYRRRARTVHLAGRALPVHRLPDVCGAQLHRRAQSRSPKASKSELQDGDRRRPARRWPSWKRSARTAATSEGRSWPNSIARSPSAKEDIADSQKVMKSGPDRPGRYRRRTRPGWVRPFVEEAQENPELVSLKIQEAASNISWLLIPISVPFLWLLFPFGRRYRLYDHTVFVTYSLSFMMMLVIAAGLLVASGWPALAGLAVLRSAVPHVPAAEGRLPAGPHAALCCGRWRWCRSHSPRPVSSLPRRLRSERCTAA